MLKQVKKVALVDFDGVILKNKVHLNKVVKRIEQFVAIKTGIKNKVILQSFNKEIYSRYGHTFLGLRDLGYVRSLSEFNDYIYDEIISDDELYLTEEEIANWRKFQDYMEDLNIDVQLFSNSPVKWMQCFLAEESLYDLSYSINKHQELLKPEDKIYSTINGFYPGYQKIFIDDKLSNFGYPLKDEEWSNIWIVDSHETLKIGRNLTTCKDLRSINLIH